MGAKKIVVHKPARCGDRLVTTIRKTHKFEDFGVVQGRIERNGECLAEGEIKVYHKK